MEDDIPRDESDNQEIDSKEFDNPNSAITKAIFFIYSLETFVVYSLNKAERDRDTSKILSFGP